MNRKVTLTFFLVTSFFIFNFTVAQQSKTDEIDLASALVTAKTQEERNQLLESKKHLVTPQLVMELIHKGNQFRIRGEYTKARELFELAKNLADSLNDRAGVAEALNSIGSIHYFLSEFSSALEYFQQSLHLSEAIGNQSGIAQSLNHIGRVRYMLDELDIAYDHFNKSLSIRESIHDRAGIAESLSGIGIVHYLRAENDKALEYLKRSLALREELKDEEGIAASLTSLGLVESTMRNYESAEAYLKKGLVLREKLGDKVGLATAFSSLGSIQYDQANYDDALQHYQKSLKLTEELGNRMQKSWNLAAMGQTYQSLGHYRLALDAYQKSLKLREEVGEKSGVAHSLNLIGNLQYRQGNYKVALEYHKKGLQISETLQDKRESANALMMMGMDYKMQEENEKALECYEKSLSISEAIQDKFAISSVLNDIALLQSKIGNRELAMKNLERSLALSEEANLKDITVDALSSISTIQYEQGNYTEALDNASRAVSLARHTGSRPLLWESLTNLGKAYYAMNQTDKAIQSLKDAIQTIESLRTDVAGGEQDQQRYFENKVVPYHLIVDFLAQKGGRETEALAYAERAKARALLDVLQRGRVTIAQAMTREELDQERNLNRKLISLNQKVHQAKLDNEANEPRMKELTASLEKARLNMEEFRTAIYAAHPELKIQRGEAEIITPNRLNELLTDPLIAFLEYVVTPEKILLFVITKKENLTPPQANVYNIHIKQSDLSSRIKNFRVQMANREPTFRREALSLHNLLIEPANEILKGKSNLVIVPDDVLWEMPFQALLSPQERYLLEDYSLSYVPSLTVLNEMKNLQKKKPGSSSVSLFAMGNPTLGTKTREQLKQVYRDANLDPLPQAEKEVMELAKLYGNQSTIYVGANAREDRIKNEAGKYKFLHLATHGLLNDSTPMYSQILLAQSDAQEEDGLLEAWEILNLKLDADLVVLSACDTALGRVGKGEGMIGLSWALFVAGIPTTVVSQWTVDSASTTELMIQFHQKLRLMASDSSSKNPVSYALREAALKLLQADEYRHPFYWAPFVVIGAGF